MRQVLVGLRCSPRNHAQYGGMEQLIAVYAFAFQIYGDFSGYSDIARGAARTMGFELVRNFDLPYFATNPSDFWKRWHISLSTWLRDYLYIPLGGNRLGKWTTYRNLMLTMVLGGLWHGAAWTFVAWGVYHGALLGVHRALEPWLARHVDPRGATAARAWRVARTLFFFQLTCVGWLLFRAESIGQATSMLAAVLTDVGSTVVDADRLAILASCALLLFLWQLLQYLRNDPYFLLRRPAPQRALVYASAILAFLWLGEYGAMHSSTSSSERQSSANGLPWGLLLALPLLGAVELAVRRVEPAELIDYVPNRAEQYAAVADWLDAYGPAPLAFVGSSRMLLGIVPSEVRAACEADLGRPLPVGNYACDGFLAEDVDSSVRHLLRAGRPELLLYGLTPRAVVDTKWEWLRSAYFWRLGDWWSELRRSGRGVVGELPEVVRNEVGRRWLSLRYRRSFLQQFRTRVLGTSSAESFPARGELAPVQLESPERTLATESDPAALRRQRRVLSRTRHGISAERVERIGSMLAACAAADVPVVLFELPLNPSVVDKYPHGLLERFRTDVAEVAGRHGVRFVPWPELGLSIPPEHFRDFTHLNRLGASTLSAALAERVVLPALRAPASDG